jgi:magnesium transporter
MPLSAARRRTLHQRLRSLNEAFERGTLERVQRLINELHPAEIAHLLESLPPAQREVAWELASSSDHGEILVLVKDEVREDLIRWLEPDEIVAATEGLDTDDLVDLLQELPDAVTREVLLSMDSQNRRRLETVLSYPEDCAGGLMNIDTITVRPDVSIDVVLRYLRMRGQLPDLTDSLIVVNRFDRYLGLLPLTTLLTSSAQLNVGEVMVSSLEGIQAATSAKEVAALFEHRDLVSAPVIDPAGRLLGRITIDDVVDVIREEADHSLLGMAGLDEAEDLFAPVVPSTRRRAVWLGINLCTALLASWVIGLFDATIEKVVALAVLMPVVASMGGIAGSQTLTLVIRGLALGQIGRGNTRWLISKEVAVGMLNGALWAVVVASVTAVWFQNLLLGLIIGSAMVVNQLGAALAGVGIPLLLQRLKIDPALAGSVILTTVTDVVGFMAFLGLGTLVLL